MHLLEILSLEVSEITSAKTKGNAVPNPCWCDSIHSILTQNGNTVFIYLHINSNLC